MCSSEINRHSHFIEQVGFSSVAMKSLTIKPTVKKLQTKQAKSAILRIRNRGRKFPEG